MNTERNRTLSAILRILSDAGKPLGSMQISRELNLLGISLQPRMVRYYLRSMDGEGWTENLGRPGRRLTPRGHDELRNAVMIEKVGFVSARVGVTNCATFVTVAGTVVVSATVWVAARVAASGGAAVTAGAMVTGAAATSVAVSAGRVGVAEPHAAAVRTSAIAIAPSINLVV